ncbi:Nucleotide-binding alpha-beta plait domain [Phytophthora cactorum]|nr:Nucleotide-binding alpha-beta plait domain [Phytophthora cactorum]
MATLQVNFHPIITRGIPQIRFAPPVAKMEEGPMASTKLYVGNLFYELTQRDVEAEFGKFGPIEQCAVKKGYAFVHYEQLEDAELAVQEMNDKELGGRRLRVAFAVSHGTQRRFDGPPPPMQNNASQAPPPLLHSPRFPVNASPNLFVANIPPHIKMSELDQAFAQFGEVKNVKVLPQARPDAPMSAFVDYTDVSSAQKAHSATIMVAGQHLRTDYNFRKSKGDGPRRTHRGSFDGSGSFDGEERGGSRYDSFDSQSGRKGRYEDEFEDPGHRRHHHHRHSSRHHSSRHSREDPEERGRSVSPPRYRRHSSSSSMRRGEEASGVRERSRDYPGERAFGRPDEIDEFQQPERRPYYESRPRGEERMPREYSGRGMDKSPQEYRRFSRPETSSRHGSRRGPRNDRSWYVFWPTRIAAYASHLNSGDATTAIDRSVRANVDSSFDSSDDAAAGLEEKICHFILFIYALALLLSTTAAASSSLVENATPVIIKSEKRGLRDEAASLATTDNEEKICYFLFWPFQC